MVERAEKFEKLLYRGALLVVVVVVLLLLLLLLLLLFLPLLFLVSFRQNE